MSEEDKIDPKKIFAAFEEQLEPPENYRISRLKLTQYRQTQEESLDHFTNRCKLQDLKCDFVDDELNERLIELIISSTPIVDFQKELLNKPKCMKLHEALALGRSYEASATHVKQIQQLHSDGQAQQMNAVQNKRETRCKKTVIKVTRTESSTVQLKRHLSCLSETRAFGKMLFFNEI